MNPHVFILAGNCVDLLRSFPDASIDAVVTDPPYGLSKEPDTAEVMRKWLAEELREHARRNIDPDFDPRGEIPAHLFPDEPYQHRGGGFMGKTWDSFVPGPEVWREVFRVLKPGGHLVSFFGTRTYDLGCMAIRLAGFQIRDQLAWMYGTGFPKSMNVALAIDRRAGIAKNRGAGFSVAGELPGMKGKAGAHGVYVSPEGAPGVAWQGWGTALCPGLEPIVLARKPLEGTIAANVLEHGTGGIHVDACRIGTEIRVNTPAGNKPGTHAYNMGVHGMPTDATSHEVIGRWPKNVVLDEQAAAMLDEQTGDSGDPSRFFYVAKASTKEREAGLEDLRKASASELTGGRAEGSAGLENPRAGAGRTSEGRANSHPTVKPLALMRWLVRLITPLGGTVLDPFAGSGSTGCAAVLEGFHFVGCELSEEYVAIAEARIAHWREVGEAA